MKLLKYLFENKKLQMIIMSVIFFTTLIIVTVYNAFGASYNDGISFEYKDIGTLQSGQFVNAADYIIVKDGDKILVNGTDYNVLPTSYKYEKPGSAMAGTYTWNGQVQGCGSYLGKILQKVSLSYTVAAPTTQAPVATTQAPATVTTQQPASTTRQTVPVDQRIELTRDKVQITYKTFENDNFIVQLVDSVYYNGEKVNYIIIHNIQCKNKVINNLKKSTYDVKIEADWQSDYAKFKGGFTVPVKVIPKQIEGKVTIWKFMKKYANCGLFMDDKRTGTIGTGKGYPAVDFSLNGESMTWKYDKNIGCFSKEGNGTQCTPATLKKKYTAANGDPVFINAMLDDFEKISVSEKKNRVCNRLYNDVAKAAKVVGRTVKVYVRTPATKASQRGYTILKTGYIRAYVDEITLSGYIKGGIASVGLVNQIECKIQLKGSKKWYKFSTNAVGPAKGTVDSYGKAFKIKKKYIAPNKIKCEKARFYRVVDGKKYYSKWVKVTKL